MSFVLDAQSALPSGGGGGGRGWKGGGLLPFMGYIGTCIPKGCGFLAVLVIDRVSILASLVIIRVCF